MEFEGEIYSSVKKLGMIREPISGESYIKKNFESHYWMELSSVVMRIDHLVVGLCLCDATMQLNEKNYHLFFYLWSLHLPPFTHLSMDDDDVMLLGMTLLTHREDLI